MRRVLTPVLAMALLVWGCGADDSSSSPTTEPRAPATTSAPVTTGTQAPPSTGTASANTVPAVPTTQGEVPPTTEAPPPTTSVDQLGAELAVLRPGGLGGVDFGTPADEAIAELTTLLGPPDRVDALVPIGESGDGCVEGAGWLDCLRDLRVLDEGRLATWGTYGLEIALVDTQIGSWPLEQTSLQFGDWHATIPTGQTRLVTAEGLRPGMTVGELRRAVPDIEFGSNEGSLDSFSVTLREHAGYWGRLDWNPETDVIEGWDVSAVQAALNEHGASLVVDGEWGPLSEAAWVQILTDHGFEAFTPQLWLVPEIGEALGLPPDDITVATLEPRPTGTSFDTRPSATLRPDGLGHIDFGTPADVALPQLIDLLGPPDSDSVSTDQDCVLSIERTRTVSWDAFGLHLLFTDWPGNHDLTPAPLHLATWSIWSTPAPRVALATTDGIGIGSTAHDVRSLPNSSPIIPNVTQWGFAIATEMGTVEGDLGWSVNLPYYFIDEQFAAELQQALNVYGANLTVDGDFGPATTDALIDFAAQQSVAGFSIDPEFDSIRLTPQVLEVFWLLELPPDDAPVLSMWAGDPSTCG